MHTIFIQTLKNIHNFVEERKEYEDQATFDDNKTNETNDEIKKSVEAEV